MDVMRVEAATPRNSSDKLRFRALFSFHPSSGCSHKLASGAASRASVSSCHFRESRSAVSASTRLKCPRRAGILMSSDFNKGFNLALLAESLKANDIEHH